MLHHLRVSIVVMVAAVNFSSLAFAQSQRAQQPTAGKEPEAGTASHPKTASAPRHDISGTWEPARGPQDGVQADGVKAMPNDGKPEHRLPYTPYGEQVSKSHHALEGASAVLPGFFDDPRDKCEPLGFPRTNFYNLRETQILQNEYKVVILYQYATTWRVIWTDGRELPKLVDGGVLIGKEVKEPRYTVTQWESGWTIRRSSFRRLG